MNTPVRFDEYYLIERIAVGGMAEVFKGMSYGSEGFERLSAVKRVLPHIAEDREFIEMFIDEAKIAAQLQHPNIGQVYHLGQWEDQYFIAMEYIAGQDLRIVFDRARNQRVYLDIGLCVFLIREMCEALDYAHRKTNARQEPMNIIHRDISPQNIILSYDGAVKLVDFGIAKSTGKISQTQVGILKGKFSYMSPEQARGDAIDARSDLFALAVVFYELLTLERCFLGASDYSTIERVRDVEFSPPRKIRREIPGELERIIYKGLAKDPNQRFQSAADFQESLDRYLRAHAPNINKTTAKDYIHWSFKPERDREQSRLEEFRQYADEYIPEAHRHGQSGVKFAPISASRPHAVHSSQRSRPRFAIADEPKISFTPRIERRRTTESAPQVSTPSQGISIRQRIFLLTLLGFFAGGVTAMASWVNPPSVGSLRISQTTPTQLSYILKGEELIKEGVTPAHLTLLPTGQYSLTLKGERYTEERVQVQISQDSTRRVSPKVSLKPNLTELSIFTEPIGATVTIDNKLLGETPLNVIQPTGEHSVTLKYPAYQSHTQMIMLSATNHTFGPVILSPSSVKVTFIPLVDNAELFVRRSGQLNWRRLGQGEQQLTVLNRGDSEIQVKASGYHPKTFTLPKYKEVTAMEWIELEKLQGEASSSQNKVNVLSDPSKISERSSMDQSSKSTSTSLKRSKERQKIKKKRRRAKSLQKRARARARERVREERSTTPKRASRSTSPLPSRASSPPKQPGLLKLMANPPAEVFIKGKAIGWTPLVKYKLPEGSHRLTLKLANGETHKILVVIHPGQETLRKWKRP